jgi:putative phage-type endonuclease
MGKITRVSTVDMPREEWLEIRRQSIGGSDAAAVLGLNDYVSPYSLWAEKTGKIIPEDISDKEAVRLGNDLEDYVAQRFTEATGKRVRRDNAFIYNSDYPFAHALVDRMVVGENAGLECKTTSSWEILDQCRSGEYPPAWYCQMMHYMMVTGADKWHLAVLIFGKGFFEFEVLRKESEIEALASAERAFWSGVTTKSPPALDGEKATTDALKVIYAESIPDSSIDLGGVSSHIALFDALGKQIKELEKDRDTHMAVIQDYMGAAERGETSEYKISWKTQIRNTFDRKAYEAANGPISSMYFKQSTARPFRLTVKKNA